MNVFDKTALRGLQNNRTRTLATVTGVALSAALVAAVAVLGTSLLSFMLRTSIARCGDWHTAFLDADAAFVQSLTQDKAAERVTVWENIGYAPLEGEASGEKPYLFLAGFSRDTFDALPISLLSGRLPEGEGELLIPSHLAIKGGIRLSVGDTVTLQVGRRMAGEQLLTQHDPLRPGEETLADPEVRTYTVVGLYERPGFEESGAPGYTAITWASGQTDHLTALVTLAHPRQARDYAADRSGGGPVAFNDDVLRFFGASEDSTFLSLFYAAGGILAAIIVTSSVFLIGNAFHISLNEQIQQLGMLMSVGATERQLRRAALFEGLCIGAMGIPLGLLAGTGAAALLLPVVAGKFSTMTGSTLPLTLQVSPLPLAAAAALSLGTILLSAYFPARKTARTPVLACIRQTREVRLTPGKTPEAPRLIWRLGGLEGALAYKNFRRSRRRYRSVVLSLTMSVVLFVTGSAFSRELKALGALSSVEMDGDAALYTDALSQEEMLSLHQQISQLPEVDQAVLQANLTGWCATEGLPQSFLDQAAEANGTEAGLLPLEIQLIPDALYGSFLRELGLPEADCTGPEGTVLIVLVDTRQHRTYFTGDTAGFSLLSAGGQPSLTLRAIFTDAYPLDSLPADGPQPAVQGYLVAPWSRKADFDALSLPTRYGITVWSGDGAQATADIQALLEKTGTAGDCTLVNLSATEELFRSANFVIDVFTALFVSMIALIAAANVFNTISTNIRLRRRELAILRSVGMTDRAFSRMMGMECLFYGAETLVLGLPLAAGLAWLIHRLLASLERLEDFPFRFPWDTLLLSAAGVFAMVSLTMVYATGKAKRENILDALRDDLA